MAYAERRGKGPRPWRVKYCHPDGTEVSELAYGRDQEARIREGRWTDPAAGKLAVGEWIDRWLTIQDVGISNQASREYQIRQFLRPAWNSTPLASMASEDITKWENGLPSRLGVSRRTARDARGLLCTNLREAAATRPPLIQYTQRCGLATAAAVPGGGWNGPPQRAWPTPLQALLLTEQAALMSGRDKCSQCSSRSPIPVTGAKRSA